MWRKVLIGGAAAVAVLALGIVAWIGFAVQDLPDTAQLKSYEPPISTRVHAGDGALVAEFAREQRVFVPVAAIPANVQNAFISAEDKGFYSHSGLDYVGIARATLNNVGSIFTGDGMQGASTITQQVAKNMLLTSDRTITRKVKEAFLAQRIEQALSKQRILELYLNEIYLGRRAYGVAAASLTYFNKGLDELSLAQSAYLAVLPKAPNNYDPDVPREKERAVARRNWVLDRMVENGHITAEEAEAAKKEDLLAVDRGASEEVAASAHFVEELRRETIAIYGEKKLYDEGLSIRSTLDTRLQVAAAAALRRGLDQYDRRKGWRGAVGEVSLSDEVVTALQALPNKIDADGAAGWSEIDNGLSDAVGKVSSAPALSGWGRAVVLSADAKAVSVAYERERPVKTEAGERRVRDIARGALAKEELTWIAEGQRRNKAKALKRGDVLYVQPLKSGALAARQIPLVDGGLVAMDANTGRVLAMVGGYSFANSQFNRVTQAVRQPGSTIKPFVYAAGLDYGLTPATLVEDAPFAMEAGDGSVWSPENYTKEFYGPTTLRRGLEMSRNAMTVRLAYNMGLDRVVDYGKRMGVYDDAKPYLSLALGAQETTLMRMVTGYAAFVNGGKKVTPTLVDRIQDRYGKTVYVHDRRACVDCVGQWAGQAPPRLPDTREQILNPITAYQITSMLEGAVSRGTGTAARIAGKPVAGKTGTTNDYLSAWFVGFSPDIVAGVYVGYDQPKSMGEGETGGRLAAPIFGDFMKAALANDAGTPFRAPPGVRFVNIDTATGMPPTETTDPKNIVSEAFSPGSEPGREEGAQAFVFGQGTAIDAGALSELSGLFGGDAARQVATDEGPTGPPPAPGQAPATPVAAQRPQEEALGGLY
jgi:penicillin-binding protein 1A